MGIQSQNKLFNHSRDSWRNFHCYGTVCFTAAILGRILFTIHTAVCFLRQHQDTAITLRCNGAQQSGKHALQHTLTALRSHVSKYFAECVVEDESYVIKKGIVTNHAFLSIGGRGGVQKLVKRDELWRNCWEHLDRLSFGEHLVGVRAVVVEFADADVPVEAEVGAEQDDEVQLLAPEASGSAVAGAQDRLWSTAAKASSSVIDSFFVRSWARVRLLTPFVYSSFLPCNPPPAVSSFLCGCWCCWC